MIQMMNLMQVADIELRPTKGKIYPKGTITIQISATRGQIVILDKPREIESHYAVILPKINADYLYAVIQKFFPRFFNQRVQGLNLRSEELQHFNLPIHTCKNMQKRIGKIMKLFGNE